MRSSTINRQLGANESSALSNVSNLALWLGLKNNNSVDRILRHTSRSQMFLPSDSIRTRKLHWSKERSGGTNKLGEPQKYDGSPAVGFRSNSTNMSIQTLQRCHNLEEDVHEYGSDKLAAAEEP